MTAPVPKVDLRPDHWAIVRDALRRHVPDREVLAFGSRATWTAKNYSDLDLAVMGEEPLSLRTASALDEALGDSDLPFKVDVVDWARIDEGFRRIVRRHGVLVQGAGTSNNVAARQENPTKPDWPVATIDEIATRVAMGPFGSSIKVSTFVPKGIPIISGQHLHGARVDDSSGHNFITEAHADRLSRANVRRGDIVFTHAGSIGQVAHIPESSQYRRYVISQRQFYMRCDRSLAIPGFVTRYFKSPQGQHQLLANASQVGVPSIAQPVSYLRTITIPLPPLPEQRAIAHILGTLDDKIELNRRMNETLEAMARALFKSWFVDFDPVRAKMEGRDTGLPHDIADLFPDGLVDSELGEIPEGWVIKPLGDLCHKPQYGFTASAQEEPVGPRFLRITDINKESWVSWSRVPYCGATNEQFAKYRLSKGDVLIARMADPGHGIMVEEDLEAVFASYLIRFRPIDSGTGRFLQYWLRSDPYWHLVRGRATGTTRRSLNARVLSRFPMVAPPTAVVVAFARLVGLWRVRLVANAGEMETLAALRDTLLPKFISGEIRVPDAERALESVT